MSKIQWTQKTWNPVVGCSLVSLGCQKCYAMKMAKRLEAMGNPNYAGLTKTVNGNAVWTGKVRCLPEKLGEPLKWKTPARVFVNSMSDLFHEGVPNSFIRQVFDVMAGCPKHTFQVLTKRPERMKEWIGPRNVWLGVSVEDQKTADERIPLLLQTPAAVRFVSYEPALQAVDFSQFLNRCVCASTSPVRCGCGISWLICGGESGPSARPFDIQWARDTIRQCREAGVACFVKQLGSVPVMDENEWLRMSPAPMLNSRLHFKTPPHTAPLLLRDKKGGSMEEWPEDLRVREYPA